MGTPKLGDKRALRSESVSVTLRTDDGETHPYTPGSVEELTGLAPGTQHAVP